VTTVDIVLVLHRPGNWLAFSVSSLRSITGVSWRLIVVDNAPTDANQRELRASVPDVTYIACERNVGFAVANNRGIAMGTAPYILCLNQDAAIAPDYLQRLVDRMEADRSLGSVAGKLLHLPDVGAAPDGRIDSAGLAMGPGRRAADIGQGEVDDGRFDGWREVFGVSAAAAVYRRSALADVAQTGEVFDERFFMYKEDVDLAWRLRRAGFTSGVDGSALAWHGRSMTRVGRDDRVPAPFGGLVAAWLQERAKPAPLRALSWRNQWLMVINNERPDDFFRSLPHYVAAEGALATLGLVLDPLGTLRSRASLLAELPAAVRRRRFG
jgi:GT2 family glycosyltransferase